MLGNRKSKILNICFYTIGICLMFFALAILFSESLQSKAVEFISIYKNKSPNFMHKGLPVSYYWLILLKKILLAIFLTGGTLVITVKFGRDIFNTCKKLYKYVKENILVSEKKAIDFINSNFIFFLIFILSIYLLKSFINIVFMESWLDEGKYYMKGYWWVTGKIAPYTSDDAVGYMPLFFYIIGYWQLLFGKGLIVSRILPTIVGLPCFYMVFKVGEKIFKTHWKIKSLLAIYFFVLTPMAIFYFNAINAYSILILVTLILFYIVLTEEKFHWLLFSILVGGAFFILHFFRPNMIVGIAFFSLYILFFCKKKRFLKFVGSGVVYLLVSLIFVQFFPPALSYFTLRLPVVSRIVDLLAIIPDPFKLVEKNTYYPGEVGYLSLTKTLYSFTEYFLTKYFHTFVLTIVAFFVILKQKRMKSSIAICLLYFIVQFIVHFAGSQYFCMGCIQAYTGYFYLFGCMAAVVAVKPMYQYFKEGNLFKRLLVLGFILIGAALSVYNFNYYISDFGSSYISKVRHLANEIDDFVPDNEKLLIIGGVPLGTQAAFFADRRMEITSINQNHSYKRLKEGLSESEKKETLRQMRLRAVWTDEMMEGWISDEYNYILAHPIGTGLPGADSYFEKYYTLIDRHFILINEVKLVNDRKYYIYKRKGLN